MRPRRPAKRDRCAKLEQMGRNVFGPSQPSAEATIAAIEALYRSINMPVHLRDTEVGDAEAVARIMQALRDHGTVALGGHAGLDQFKTERIIRAACSASSR